MNRTVWGIAMLMTITLGCSKEPFRRGALPPLVNRDPQAVRNAFAVKPAAKFTSDDTVVIKAPFRDEIAVLGVLQVDRTAGTFELLGLSHMGVQIFHVAGDRDGVSIRSAVPQLMENKRVLEAIAQDTHNMYFDLVPPAPSKGTVTQTTVELREKTKDGTLVYVYGGDPVVLLEKRLDAGLGSTWRVRYYDYAMQAHHLYPRGIVMQNGQFHYRIVVKNRALSIDP